MGSFGQVWAWLLRHRFTVVFCVAVVVSMLANGITGRGSTEHSWWRAHVPILTAGCTETTLKCIDDYCNGSGASGDTGAIGYSPLASVSFERNIGQADSHYEFIAQGARHSVQLAATEAVFDFPGSTRTPARRIRATVEGAQAQVQSRAEEPLTGRVNYFRGNDPKKWITDIPTFARVTFPQVYPGIDLTYHGAGGFVENDFIVNPGADPSQIRIRFDGADDVRVEKDGSLSIAAGRRGLKWRKPSVYQATATGRKNPVEGRFRRDPDGGVGFEVGLYDLQRPLVIDPVITYATYFGTPATESAIRVATDASGNAYFIGTSDSGSFPVSPTGTYFLSVDGGLRGDVIVAKLSADGKQRIFTTHIGGGESNTGVGIALDASGNLFLTGLTASSDFPHTSDLTTHSILPNENCFVTKLNPAANAILYSTLIGGSDEDGCAGIGVDSAGNAYAAGFTMSTDLPTVNPVQSTLQTSYAASYNVDAFVVKLSPDGTKLLYSTYLGGTYPDAVTAVAVDSAGNAYLTGYTASSNFPVSSSGFQQTFGGAGGQFDPAYSSGDAFVVKMSPSGTIVYSTYLGGSKDDIGFGIAIDAQGNAYVGGSTLSANFPTLNPFQTAYGGAGGETNPVLIAGGDIFYGGDGFVAELNPTGTALVFSSYLGGSQDDRVLGIAVDSTGNIWATGHTLSQNFPVSQGAPQTTYAGDDGGGPGQMVPQMGDAFLTEIGVSRTVAFSTFLGGSSADWASGVAVDGQGGVIIAGGTSSTNFPSSIGAYQTKYAGLDLPMPAGDALIARFGGAVTGPVPSIAGISSTASYVGGGVAPGEAVLIAGSFIGPSAIAGAALDATGKVSSLVAGTQFFFDGVPAPIVYVSSGYSSVIVPYEVAGKATTQLVAVFSGVASAPVSVAVKAAIPGIFSADASGSGTAAIINPDGTRNSPQNPAARGTSIAFFVTGEGQTIPPGIDGSVTASLIKPAVLPLVSIGGITATDFQYLGEAPGEVAGVLQINVTIPTSAPTGNVPLVISIGTAVSQPGLTVAVK